MTPYHHIAEINIARVRAPLTDPLLVDFVRELDSINAVAEADPDFVWRLVAEDGGPSTYVRAYDDDSILINMSVWKSIDALHNYVYRSRHVEIFRARKKWFVPLGSHPFAMWWIPVGTQPTIQEGQMRLELLNKLGPTEEAFTFKTRFSPPSVLISQ